MASRDCIAGIDFGTSYCTASINYPNGNTKTLILDGPNNKHLRSMVKYSANNVAVGEAAKDDEAVVNGNVVFKVKSVIGKKVEALTEEEKRACGARVVADENGFVAFYIPILNEIRSAIDVASEIFKAIYRRIISETNGYDIQSVIITYPAAFDQNQLAAIRTAAATVIQEPTLLFFKEPTAATYAYLHINQMFNKKSTFLVYDLGGGTFDISLVEVENNTMRVLKTDGLPNVGGELFDALIEEYFVKEYEQNTGFHLLQEEDDDALRYKVLTLFRTMCKTMKENVCKRNDPQHKEMLDLNGFFRKWNEFMRVNDDDVVEECYDYHLTISILNDLIDSWIDQTLEVIQRCLHDCHLGVDAIDGVIIVGGSSNIPLVRKKLTEFFDHGKLKFELDVNACVSYGASLFARYRDVVQEEYVEGTKYDYFTKVLKYKDGKKIIKPTIMIKKGTPFNETIEKEYKIPKEYGGILQDVIFEGDAHNTARAVELARIECTNMPQRIKYVFRFAQDGLLHYRIEDSETRRVLLQDMCLSRL